MLDIGKYEFSVLGILYQIISGIMYLVPKFFYIQIGIDLVAENKNMNPNLIDWSFLFIKDYQKVYIKVIHTQINYLKQCR